MKKLLSAVMTITMIITAAILTSTVLAQESTFTSFVPEDGSKVVYLSSTGSVTGLGSGKEFNTIASAVNAVKTGGYVIVLDTIDMGTTNFPSHSGMVIIRGADGLDTKAKLRLRHMRASGGPLTFENIDLEWYQAAPTDNDSSLQMSASGYPPFTEKLVLGENVNFPNGCMITGVNIEVNGATNFGIRMGRYGDNLTVDSVNIVINDGKVNAINATHGATNSTTTVNGDVNIEINGGTLVQNYIGNVGTFDVKGNLTFKVSGGIVEGGKLIPANGGTIKVSGAKTLDTLAYPGEYTNFDESAWDVLMTDKVYLSDNGDDNADGGTPETAVKSLDKAIEILKSIDGNAIIVADVATFDGVTEPEHTEFYIYMAQPAGKIVIKNDFVLNGPSSFNTVILENGGNGAIVAAGNNLSIMNGVKTLPDANGTYLDIFGGKRDELCVVKLNVATGTYNNIDTIGKTGSESNVAADVTILGYGPADDYVMDHGHLVNTCDINGVDITSESFTVGRVAMLSPKASEGIFTEYYFMEDGSPSTIRANNLPYVRVEYYLYARETDEIGTCYPTLTVGGETLTSTTSLVTNQWGVAVFDMSSIRQYVSGFTFRPYGDATGINKWNKMYIPTITFSQGFNDVAPTYPLPDMTEDGDGVSYVFNPAEEGLEVLPVVYYAEGGVYNGDAEGSISSLYAYGSFTDAIKAVDKVGGGYVILTSDVTSSTVPLDHSHNPNNIAPQNTDLKHENMVIIRGMQKKEGEGKINYFIGGIPHMDGPCWLQNLNLVAITRFDVGLQAKGHEFCYGTPGAGYDDVVTLSACNGNLPYMVIGGGDGGTFNQVNIKIYSGTVKKAIDVIGGDRGSKINGDVNIEIHGGDISEASFQTGHNDGNPPYVMGNYNLTITGGKLPKYLNLFMDETNAASHKFKSYLEGNLNIKISGKPDITALQDGGISVGEYKVFTAPVGNSGTPASGVKGTTTIDILEYEGDFEALRKKIDVDAFTTRNINSIYLKDGGTGDGTSPANAFGNLSDAIAACVKEIKDGGNTVAVEGGRIVICGNGFTVDEEISESVEHSNNIIYTSVDGAPLMFASGTLKLQGPATFNNITLQNIDGEDSYIVAGGNSVVFGSNVYGVPAPNGKYVSVVAGTLDGTVASADVVINGGNFQDVITGDSVRGKSSITINGGKIYGDVIGGTSAKDGVVGSALITINGGDFYGDITGGNAGEKGVIEQTAITEINGGNFSSDTTITAGNTNATATVSSNAEINIFGGDFSKMSAGQIKPGSGTVVDKTCVDYKNYQGNVNVLINAIGKGFDVVVDIPVAKPEFTASDKFIYIVQHIGDPTKALTKKTPFTITQRAEQKGKPIVVSPHQLNLKMDGSDHALMSVQTVQDAIETIRFIPNHSPTTGSAIVVDGYNINSRGVDVPKYKYIEIVYYYTVPEGETPAVKNMELRYLGDYVGKVTVKTDTLVPNQWTSAVIDVSELVADLTGSLKQYHFYPMGGGKKGTDVPETQYLDIVSLTFYTDKPNTVIKGGNAPSLDLVEDEDKPTTPTPEVPATVEDISVNVSRLKNTVDGSDSFTAAAITKDDMEVIEYTPNISSEDEMRIEGYNCMGQAISLNHHKYLTMKIYVETERTDVRFIPSVYNCNGGVQDNPEKAKTVLYQANRALVPNQWNTITINMTPSDPAFHITRQIYIAPLGMIKGNTMVEGEKFYLAEVVFSNIPPKTAGAADGEDEDFVEIEQEIIEEATPVVVDGSKLINSAGSYSLFSSRLVEFEGKKALRITPKNVEDVLTIDGSSIYGNTELTPDGVLSLKTHRYAVISYYYKSSGDTDRIPEFELLGGRIQDKGNVANGIIAKGTEALKRNEWATVVVKLSGNGKGVLTSGFNLKPLGNISASALTDGDVLYIENITFVSNRP